MYRHSGPRPCPSLYTKYYHTLCRFHMKTIPVLFLIVISAHITEDVHAPPSNIGTLQAAEKVCMYLYAICTRKCIMVCVMNYIAQLKEKMEIIREKRRQHKKLRYSSVIYCMNKDFQFLKYAVL